MPARIPPIAGTICLFLKPPSARGRRYPIPTPATLPRRHPLSANSRRRLLRYHPPLLLPASSAISTHNTYSSAASAQLENRAATSGSWTFGVYYGPVENDLEDEVRAQCQELLDSIKEHTTALQAHIKQQHKKQQQGLAYQSAFAFSNVELSVGREDPWTLYCCLAHDSTILSLCPHEIFTAILTYTILEVTSPQICFDRLSTIISDMGYCKIRPAREDWDMILEAYERWGKIMDVQYMLKEAQKFTALAADPSTKQDGEHVRFEDGRLYRRLMVLYTVRRHLVAAKLVAKSMMVRCVNDVLIFQKIITSFVKLRDINSAYEVFNHMIEAGVEPTYDIHLNMLDGLRFHRYLNIHHVNPKTGSQVRRINTLLLANLLLRHAAVKYPDTALFARAIFVYAKHNQAERAEKLLDIMRAMNLEPDPEIFLAFFYLNIRINRVETAHKILETLFADRSRVPNPKDLSLHRFILSSYIRCGQRFLALQHVWKMDEQLGAKLDKYLYTMLITQFAHWRPVRALQIYRMMQRDGLEPDAWVRKVMRGVFLKLEKAEEAKALEEQDMSMVENGPRWIVDCYTPILV